MFDYRNAPVTRMFMLGSGLLTILLGIKGRSSNLGFFYQDIFQSFRLWRLIASSFAFSSTPELVFGLGLLYYFRVFERQIGSNKYSVFILFSLLGSLLIEVLSLVVFRGSNLGVLASGPYGLVFASFVPFYFDIPVTSRFRIFGGRFSNKSLVYLAGLQLLLSAWERSLIPGICGILAGSMYHMNLLGIRRMKFPDFIATFFSRLPWPSTGGSSPSSSSGNSVGHVPSYTGRQLEGNYPLTTPLSSVAEPPEASIATLVSMGFDRNSARQALVHARNDINVATNILLESQSH
ncbi:hypothetical protein QJS04_geneDACA015015 [Acorus gramineus]|uniref:UBA domain-containing protein n=1 Tax=Acorus gramineus TaxID=55184 RepID=A0AAV9BTD3_ACOGR|nr:hypothetical protein QJS04_geneDACA015015 [Acorus gramineus]